MKKLIILMLMFMTTITSFSATKSDTIKVDNTKIENVIEHKTTNTKGNPVVKYYFIYNRELIPTSKTVVDKYKLAKAYKADCALAMIINRNNKHKRIVLN